MWYGRSGATPETRSRLPGQSPRLASSAEAQLLTERSHAPCCGAFPHAALQGTAESIHCSWPRCNSPMLRALPLARPTLLRHARDHLPSDDPQGSSEVAALSCLDDLTQEQLVQLLVRLRNRLAGLDLRLRNRLGAAVRQGAPAWAGEAQEAAMMEQDRAQEAVASTGGGGAAGAGQAGSGGGGGLVGLGPVVPVPLPPGVPAPFVRWVGCDRCWAVCYVGR